MITRTSSNLPMIRSPVWRQGGFSLVTAIFLIVVLAAMGAYLVTISGVQHSTVAMGIQGARAYQAAQSGIEWAANRALDASASAATCGNAPSTPTTTNFTLTNGALNGFGLAVTCQYTQHQERATVYNVYVITSAASYGTFGTLDFVSRTLQATITDAP